MEKVVSDQFGAILRYFDCINGHFIDILRLKHLCGHTYWGSQSCIFFQFFNSNSFVSSKAKKWLVLIFDTYRDCTIDPPYQRTAPFKRIILDFHTLFIVITDSLCCFHFEYLYSFFVRHEFAHFFSIFRFFCCCWV